MFISRCKISDFFLNYANKITKNRRIFLIFSGFWEESEGRLSRIAACSQLGDMKITIYDAKDFFP